MWAWISVAVLAIILTLGLLAIIVNLKKKTGAGAGRPNHRAFFLMGVVMLAVGAVEVAMFMRSDVSFVVALPLIVIGLVFFVIGLANRDTWGKN